MCGDIYGGSGQSCRVNVNTGKWGDFATGQKGGDLISLYAEINAVSQKEAFQTLQNMYGHAPAPAPTTKRPTKPKFSAPPKGTPLPKFKRKPDVIHQYRGAGGEILFLIARYEGKKKDFLPYSWSAKTGWEIKAWPSPRPLYNLDKLHARPKFPVLICEGEKAADAANLFCGHMYNVVTWQGGSSATGQADWSPLKAKRVLIWPDADEPGRLAARKIVANLTGLAKEIKYIDTSSFNGGMDAADFGFADMESFVKWAKPKVVLHEDKPPVIPEVMPEHMLETPPPAATVIHNNNLIMGSQDDIQGPPKSEDAMLWAKMGLSLNGQNNPHNNSSNVSKIMARHKFLKDKIWYDEFHMKIFTTINWFGKSDSPPRPWDDGDDAVLLEYIQNEVGVANCNTEKITTALRAIPKKVIRNAPKDWMNAIKWDEAPRVDGFFKKYMGVNDEDTAFVEAVSKNFFISMVARIFDPGCKVDNMVILEGAQGKKKSTALSVLGGDWFAINGQSIGTNDFKLVLRGRMLVALDELDAFGKAEATKIKSELSTAIDTFRAPYDRRVGDHPRSSVFIGTTNADDYLKDFTGNRRFWPLKISELDIDAIASDREQLFAEAVHRYKAKENWWEVPDSAMVHQEARRNGDIWEATIDQWLDTAKLRNEHFTTVNEVAKLCLDLDHNQQDQRVKNRIGACLKALGWEPKNTKYPDSRKSVRGYFRPLIEHHAGFDAKETITRKLPNFAANI